MKKLILDIDRVQTAARQGCQGEAHRFFGEPPGLEDIEKRELTGARRMRVSSWKPPTTQWSSG